MKIMMLTAGDSIHSVRWANAYVGRGHDVVLVAINGHQEHGDRLQGSVKCYYLRFGGTKGYILNACELKKIWKAEKPDVVNVHYASGYGLLARAAGIHPYILSVWGSDVYDFPEKGIIKRKILLRNLQAADAIASTSKAMGNRVKDLLKDANRDVIITPFGVDL